MVGFLFSGLQLAYASVRSEGVLDAEVVTAGLLVGTGHSAVQSSSSTAFVFHGGESSVQICALAQAIDITDGELVALLLSLCSAGQSCAHSACAQRCCGTEHGTLDVSGAVNFGLVGLSDQLGHAEVIRSADVRCVVLHASRHGGAGSGVGQAQRTCVVRHADGVAVTSFGRRSRSVLAHVSLQPNLHAAEIRRQVANAVGSTNASVATFVEGNVGAHAVGAERIKRCFCPELGRVVTAQTQFTEAAFEAEGGTAVESQTLVTGVKHWICSGNSLVVVAASLTCAVIVVDASFQPEGSLQATAQVFSAAHAETAAVVTRVLQLGFVADRASAFGVSRVNHAEHGDCGLSERNARSCQNSQSKQCLIFPSSCLKVPQRFRDSSIILTVFFVRKLPYNFYNIDGAFFYQRHEWKFTACIRLASKQQKFCAVKLNLLRQPYNCTLVECANF